MVNSISSGSYLASLTLQSATQVVSQGVNNSFKGALKTEDDSAKSANGIVKNSFNVNTQYVRAMLRLSDDIGVMADRIGIMADRILFTELQIGVMADRILETQRIQGENVTLTENSIKAVIQTYSEVKKL